MRGGLVKCIVSINWILVTNYNIVDLVYTDNRRTNGTKKCEEKKKRSPLDKTHPITSGSIRRNMDLYPDGKEVDLGITLPVPFLI